MLLGIYYKKKNFTESNIFLCCNVIWELTRLTPDALTLVYLFLLMQVHKPMKSCAVC